MSIDLHIPTPWSWLWRHAWWQPSARPCSSPPRTQSQNHPSQELGQPETQKWELEEKVREVKELEKEEEEKEEDLGKVVQGEALKVCWRNPPWCWLWGRECVLPCKVFQTVPARGETCRLLILKITVSHIWRIRHKVRNHHSGKQSSTGYSTDSSLRSNLCFGQVFNCNYKLSMQWV